MAEAEQFVPLVRKHTDLVKASIIYLLSVVLLIVVVFPMFSQANKSTKSLKQSKAELDELSEKVVILTNLDEQVLEDRLRAINEVLPPKKDIVAYLVALDGLSRELELSLGSVSLNPGDVTEASESADVIAPSSGRSTRQSSLKSIETEVSITGKEEDIYNFLRKVENIAPLMQVKDLSMSRKEGEEDFSLSLRLAMIYSDVGSASDITGVVSLFTPDEERLYKQISELQRYKLSDIPHSEGVEGVGKESLFIPLERRLSGSLRTPEESSPSGLR